MFKWFKKLRRIVARYDDDRLRDSVRVGDLELLIRERTNIAVDLNFHEANHVIVVGRYRNTDYVQTYSLHQTDLDSVIEMLRNMERYGNVKRIDAPPQFRGAFVRDYYGKRFET